MSIQTQPASAPTDRYLHLAGTVILRAAFAGGILVTMLLAWKAPALSPLLPVLMIASVAGWTLFHFPLVNLAVVLSAFILIADFEEGIQITEAFYGLYYLGYLAHWFLKRMILSREPVLVAWEDRILFLFLILVTLSFPITILFGGSIGMAIGEWLSLSMLAFYFPVKEVVERDPRAIKVIVGVVFVVGTFVLIRNFLNYREIIASAAYAWQVTRGRAVTNEGLLMVPAFFCLTFYIYTTRNWMRLAIAGAFILFFAGLVLTQSRGYWIAFVFGTGILFLILQWRHKLLLLSTGVIAGAGASAIGMIFFGDFITLIMTGLVDRFVSIATAVVEDDSLINRFNETAAVWEHIKVNPILGYGMGVTYRFYDFTFLFSHEKPFIHNGYVSLWYKFGIWGLGMVMFFLGTACRRAYQAYRACRNDNLYVSAVALAVLSSFAAFSLSAITSNPFYVNDTMFMFAVLTGIAGGLAARYAGEKAPFSPDG